MRYECVSADSAAVRVRDPEAGTGWRFGLIERDGRRDLASEGFQEDAAGGRPATFIAVAGAYVFALREARVRGLIDR
ncbi:hypothetical protein D3273_17710 [Lichenibacterium minor]|jgi:hypothetical protein|uniref:Uncharacterized protein n=1 Tax=Lichenibacterium minor TaxID=2316528 RepID=A0A4Q2U6H0_9HYPH|nr:hypothetical protein [Lichenibacterium minor]RYC30681.1 hypothetical protein D3273_17710 [Lichenibacterium minor]